MGNLFSVSLSCGCEAIFIRCWDSFVARKHYVSTLQENLEALDSSLQELTSLKNDVKRRVELAEQQPQMKRLDQVQIWISKVENMEEQDRQVVNDGPQHIEKFCCGGYCSKQYISSYKYGKKVAEQLVILSDLKSRGEHFEEVAAKTLPAAPAHERLLEPSVGMETMFDEVWRHIEDKDVGVIGLYGMGGVGKTTLLTNINNNFLQTPNDFTPVIWIVVSKDIKLEIIQDKIAKQVGFNDDEWNKLAQHEKAQEIFTVLSRKKFMLLLDDIWDRVDLTKVGIPVSNQGRNSKIIFTTRSESVCGLMGAQKKIKLVCLDEAKALSLFQEKVGQETLSLHPDIPKLAEVVTKECGGLPLALITVGRAMACKKTPQEWNHAIHVLKKSAAEISGMGDDVFPLLKFSYDNLPSEKVKSCFLYCALFQEDRVMPRDDLLYYWTCEELLDGKYEEARNEAYDIIGTLLNACLLEDASDNLKMHDVIRDMALWLASDPEKTNESFLVQTGAQLVEAPTLRIWKDSKRVSLLANCIENLVETPKSPNLLTLFLGKNNLKMIAEGFFDFMPTLRVLDLSENKDLTTLPSGVSNLVSLHHLDLSGTAITELPIELRALTKLIFLNLEFTDCLKFVPPSTISCFQRLQVLKMRSCASCKNDFSGGGNGMIEEVQGLKHLEQLTLSIMSFSFLTKFLSYHRLLPYITDLDLLFSETEPPSLNPLKYGALKLEKKRTKEAAALGPLNPMITQRSQPNCFIGLREVCIYGSSLTDLTWLLVHAQNLKSLFIQRCFEMEIMIHSEKLIGTGSVLKELKPFAKLRSLILMDLPLLSIISESSIHIPNIEEVDISGCPALKKMPFTSISAQRCRHVGIEGEQEWWDGLVWEDQQARNVFLPFFKPTLPAPRDLQLHEISHILREVLD